MAIRTPTVAVTATSTASAAAGLHLRPGGSSPITSTMMRSLATEQGAHCCRPWVSLGEAPCFHDTGARANSPARGEPPRAETPRPAAEPTHQATPPQPTPSPTSSRASIRLLSQILPPHPSLFHLPAQ
jgi:hypothetical protein